MTWIIDAILAVYLIAVGARTVQIQKHFEHVCGRALEGIERLERLNERLEGRVRELEIERR